MTKSKAGLHKDVSKIFKGVEIPQESAAKQLPDDSQSPPVDHVSPSHLTPSPPQPKSAPKPKQSLDKPVKNGGTITSTWSHLRSQVLQQVNKVLATKTKTDGKKQNKMTLIIPILFIVFIFVFIKSFSTSAPKAARAEEVSVLGTAVVISTKKVWQIPEPYPDTLRDPMLYSSTGTTSPGSGPIIVNGIIYSEDKPSAIINNKIVHVGDKLFDATIVKMSKDEVEFERAGKKWVQKVQD